MLEAATQVAPPGRRAPPQQDVSMILPAQPKSIADTGLDRQLVLALVAKAVGQAGDAHLPALSTRLRLAVGVLREALDLLAREQLVEIAGRGDTELDIQYRLTERGKAYAAECLAQCRYVGPAPVTLDAFRAGLARDAERNGTGNGISPAELAAALAEDGIDGALREQLGAALHSGRALLLYGPSGSGKTSLARRLGRLLQGVVGVPDAVLVGGQIVQFHDPLVHLKPPTALAARYEERRNCDARWRLCQRPLVQVGAELTPELFAPRPDPGNGVCHAPAHLKASGGLLLIDDLGRQQAPVAELLNRFIGPLDNGVELLTMQGGHADTVPFAVTLLLATSVAPATLLDEPLLRRIAWKIELGGLGEAAYRALLRRECDAWRVPFDEGACDYLLGQLHGASARPLLVSYPRELLSRIADFASFAGTSARLTASALDQAWHSLFACAAAPVPVRGPVLSGGKS
jgi:energy-coupling factor transporter ATP-binding protein EcfA2/DNA-binding PadR family transcriptional regulator